MKVVEESSDRLGRWFARYNEDGIKVFSARLLNYTDELGIAWIADVGQLVENVAEIQATVGRKIPMVTGIASDGLEAAINAGRFDADLYVKSLTRKLGGIWNIKITKRQAEDVWDIVATRAAK